MPVQFKVLFGKVFAWLKTNAAVVLLGLVAGFMLGQCAHAADATVTWAHPTTRVDGSALPLTSIRETQIDWGQCVSGAFPATPAGTKVVVAPATSSVVTGLGYGTWCFRGRTVDTGGLASANSAVASKVIIAPPNPPVLSSTITVAYEVQLTSWGEIRLGRVVGTMPLGTPCVDNPLQTSKGEYYEVDRKYVTLTKAPKSSILVTQCAWQS